MNKPTKRLGFHFMRSYFDVLNEIPSDADKLKFLLSIINKQFLDEDPKDLEFVVKLSYESQRHAIEKSVKGWKRVFKTDLIGSPMSDPMSEGGSDPKEVEVEVEEKEKEKGKGKEKQQDVYRKKEFLQDWNKLRTKHLQKPSYLNSITFDDDILLNNLSKDNSRDDFTSAMVGLFKQKKMPNDNTTMQSNPTHFLKFFNSYLTAFHDTNNMLYGKKED